MKQVFTFLAIIGSIIWIANIISPTFSESSIDRKPLDKVAILKILTEIDKYNHRPVLTEGLVASSFYVCGIGSYVIDDGTATLRVFTDGQPPMQGKNVTAIIEPKLMMAFDNHFVVTASQIRLLSSESLDQKPAEGE